MLSVSPPPTPAPCVHSTSLCIWNITFPGAPALLHIPTSITRLPPLRGNQGAKGLAWPVLVSAAPATGAHLEQGRGALAWRGGRRGTKDRRGRRRGGSRRSVGRRRRREGARAPAAAAQGRGRAPSLSPPRRQASPNLLEMQPGSRGGRQRWWWRRRQRQLRRRGKHLAG